MGICLNGIYKTTINKRELLNVDEDVDATIEYAQVDEGGKLVHIRKGLLIRHIYL